MPGILGPHGELRGPHEEEEERGSIPTGALWSVRSPIYKRNGATTLFAALNTLDGRVMATCMERHRHQEWLKFLRWIDHQTPADKQLHLIVDNYATHKHPGAALGGAPFALPLPLHAHQPRAELSAQGVFYENVDE